MKVAVVGTGYVGLVGGTCLAELGHTVVCVDNDDAKVDVLRAGGLPIYEPGLEDLVPNNIATGRLTFTTRLADAVEGAEVVFIAVGTPPGEDGSADLRYVKAVAEELAPLLSTYTVVVVKSTVPVGTCDKVEGVLKRGTDVRFDVVSNPEFLREGVAVSDFLHPDRIVVGSATKDALGVMERLYKPLTDAGAALLAMDVHSSELTKYASNAMLATRISFANEIANLCSQVGADIERVREGMGLDKRIGPYFLRAGVGYGGSCFPKDVKALLKTGQSHGLPMRILDAVEAVNYDQKRLMVDLIKHQLGQDLNGRKIAMWGLAFKPDTDDMREAPSITIARGLTEAGASVIAHDPAARETALVELGDTIAYAGRAEDCLDHADALVLVTEWPEYRTPDWSEVARRLSGRHVFDGRNIWPEDAIIAAGLSYHGIGR